MELIVVIIGLLIDRLTKWWALKDLAKENSIVVIPNFFSLSYLENRGAAFGVFQNRVIFLVIITTCVLAGLVYYLVKYKPKSKLLRVSFAMIISGAIGNLIDRVYYNFVVDFILVHYKDHYFPTFNVADMFVVVGTILLAYCIIKEEDAWK